MTWSLAIFAVASGLRPVAWAAPAAGLGALQDSFATIAGKARPAVVHITTVHEEVVRLPQFFFGDPEDFFEEFFHGRPQQPRVQRFRTQGAGSGFLFDPDGFVLTNEHVVRGADQIRVILTQPNGKEKTYVGKVIGKDSYLDLAVVKVQAPGPFPAVQLGDSDQVRVGDWAMAIGSPFALGQTVTVGIVSAVRQALVIEGRRYTNLLQTDAAINRGNSGGPLLNLDGEVIGINSAIYSPSGAFAGIGFAIPVNEAKEILGMLQAGKKAEHGWLGVEVAPIDEILQKRFGLKTAEGALVNRVLPQSPAAKAGLLRGDVIRRLGTKAVAAPEDLVRLTFRAKVGEKVTLGIIRDGKERELSARIGSRPETLEASAEERPSPPEAPSGSTRWEGVEFAEADGKVVVADVANDSKLFGYLLPKDRVSGVNQNAVGDLDGLRRALASARLSEGVVFDIVRSGQPMYISVQAGK